MNRLPYLGLALIGGAFGTAAREAISLSVPSINAIPVAIFGINVLGAFLLGLLLGTLARRGPDEGLRRTMRVLLGTGFLGGFTTYSALATDTAGLLGEGVTGTAVVYSLGTVLIGGLFTWTGILLAALRPSARESPGDVSPTGPGHADSAERGQR